MYLFTTTTYPNEKSKEVAEMYLKCMAKYPDDPSVSTPLVPAAFRGTPQGIRAIVIYEVKKGKLEDAHAIALNRLIMFRDIPGYRYSVKTYINLEEGLKLIGM